MTTIGDYQDRCEQLFLAGGNAAVRRAAQQGLDRLGPFFRIRPAPVHGSCQRGRPCDLGKIRKRGPRPQADLYCWLALGHAAEDDDDHDDRAEEAFRAGLALDGDHLGLLTGYAELCLRADAFEYPARASRAVVLSRRLKELAPESAEAERLSAAERWAKRGYWDDLRMRAAVSALAGRETEAQARALAEDLRHGGGAPAHDGPAVDREAIVRAATLEASSGPWNAPVRFLGRYRTAAWVCCAVLCFGTNTILRRTGAVDSFSAWGWLWLIPLLIVDRRFAAVRKEAEARHLAALEAALADAR
ncbi:hypothetical protein [Streptomyces phaeofaciens]|uniref:hypothetical protein n=1 Tax=Streptomyces phaeofaciens TaxID=68254 RepID=UPI0036824D5C